MAMDSLGTIAPLARLTPLSTQAVGGSSPPSQSGFAGMLNEAIASNAKASEAANSAIIDLATGKAQDLHTVTLAMAQADLSFRLILELRNRLSDALQEVTRMQV